ncbi:MAG: Holliday junction branch migration DNA helicase RuvB [Deltaproteobacteria bacterium]|jgi:holliday junction DNA helicase RuvB|nr:Holliday junction branch migration DNA helicase RuvB [Deltaproteobacteria bacterium]MBT4266264.1 Holliday junction branch migration DNA helicase RuvB [Deltaproteobacteria bacterium]MBT4639975.1 Holliday junction branch migration DNA helicase RuvB [Deltaproteobacteria bacterium]MBT6503807.1 Holliday junction branch migration DNA helicase RuvB [Deltaproteobacteria bacterium]MBT6616468.1 Holliday junction branch migration DNA helicase RuvB [Deltaproteobacteria bacterium]
MENANNPVSCDQQEEDRNEYSLRPQSFSTYVGQNEMKDNLTVFIASAKKRKESLDHVLLFGPPGLGKTTMANIIAREMACSIRSTSGPVIEKQGDLAAILTSLEPNHVLFIDEIHRMNRVIEEVLYSAMEDYSLDIMIGQGPSARTIKLDLPRFTLIGATTRSGLLSTPLRERFGIPLHFNFYEPQELKEIIIRSAVILDVQIFDEAALEIGKRSRGTPRIANRLLKRARDFADMKTEGVITTEIVGETLFRLGIDVYGLDRLDRKLLKQIIEIHDGGPVGINTIAATVSEEIDTIEEVVEPYLLKSGMIRRTPRGRVVTQKAYQHLESFESKAHL